MNTDQELLLIDKPKGISSFDVIRILRRKLNIRKMGHAGTLDPAASGLMIIGVEKGTKKLTALVGLDKKYLVDVLIGTKTDSGDLEGKIIETKTIDATISEGEAKEVLISLLGEIEIQPSVYSAIKLKGKPLYKYAREGIAVEAPKRTIKIYELNFVSLHKEDKQYILKVELYCSKGTYARSIAEMIGERLGYPSTVKELRRIQIGQFTVENAMKIEDNYPARTIDLN